jgi:hypothetical protein
MLALGRFSLNVFGIPAATEQQPCLAHFLQAVCERLLPAVVTLPLSIDELEYVFSAIGITIMLNC